MFRGTVSEAAIAAADEAINEAIEGRAAYATTVSEQEVAVQYLKGAGFEPIKTFINPNTDNEVTLWFRAPTTTYADENSGDDD